MPWYGARPPDLFGSICLRLPDRLTYSKCCASRNSSMRRRFFSLALISRIEWSEDGSFWLRCEIRFWLGSGFLSRVLKKKMAELIKLVNTVTKLSGHTSWLCKVVMMYGSEGPQSTLKVTWHKIFVNTWHRSEWEYTSREPQWGLDASTDPWNVLLRYLHVAS